MYLHLYIYIYIYTYLKSPNLVNGNLVSAREILRRPREERLCKKEPRDPKVGRHSAIDPVLEEGEPREQVRDVGAQRLERGEGALHP